MSNSTAREGAIALLEAFEFEPTSLVSYRSNGKLLVLGDASQLQKCADLPSSIEFEAITVAPGKVQVQGYLGAYLVEVSDNPQKHQGDAILDLGSHLYWCAKCCHRVTSTLCLRVGTAPNSLPS